MPDPGSFRLEVYRGDTKRWRFVLWQDDAKTIPVNLAGIVVKAEIRVPGPDGALRATLTCTVTAPNIIDAVLPAAASAQVDNGAWDLQLTYPGGDVVTALSGPVVTTLDITR